MSDQPAPPPDPTEYWLGLWAQLTAPVHSLMQNPVALAFLQEIHETVQLAVSYWSRQENNYADIGKGLSARVADLLARQELETADMATMQRQIFELQALVAEQLATLIDATEPLSGRQKKLLHFSLRQLKSMLDPQNAFFSNPDLVARAIETRGQLLINASNNYLADIAESRFGLQPKRALQDNTDPGQDIATAPGAVVFQNDLIQLIHYRSATRKQREIPLLIIPPCINRFYIFDLSPEASMIRWLLDQGQDVYMVSWINPDATLADLGFADYVRKGCLQAADVAAEISKTDQVNLVGYCIGGLIAAIASASGHGKERIASLSLFSTLLDYSEPGELGIFTSPGMLEAVCSHAREEGILSGHMLSTAFTFLQEEQLFWRFFRSRYLRGEEAVTDALMYWGQDATNLPAKMAAEYLQKFYGDNALAADEGFLLDDELINLKSFDCPQYILACERDHIVPLQSALDSAGLLGGNPRIVQASGGHVRGVFNHPGQEKAYYRVTGKRDLNTGSWWTDWNQWLEQLSGGWVEGKICAPAQYASIEVSPGSYVRANSRK
ncbi:MAG: PHA/PHB synthase family protein [Porticoccaceae bacterium]